MMKNKKRDNKSISKFLCLILRHNPQAIGATLDENGWLPVRTLINGVNKHYHNYRALTPESLEEIVSSDTKNRYEMSSEEPAIRYRDGKIRARQGHSLSNVDLELKPQTPPDVLYHGTVRKFIHSIFKNGLVKGTRQHVHLSADWETAKIVGSRRGQPVVLLLNAEEMHKDGVEFYLSTNGVWLTDRVDPKYIDQCETGGMHESNN